MHPIDRIHDLFERRGGEVCTLEPVPPRAHALQAATMAEDEGAPPALVVAALLHDIGHFLARGRAGTAVIARGRADIAALGMDARHEELAYRFLGEVFGPDVTEPVRLHVQAKRYLCAVDPSYFEQLGASSLRSLELQGGPLSRDEVQAFEASPYVDQAIRLRRIDDRARVRGMATPTLDDFRCLLEAAACVGSGTRGRLAAGAQPLC